MNIKPLATVWLDAKSKQRDLAKRKQSIVKLIQSKHDRLSSLQTVIENEINDFRLKLHSIDAEIQTLEDAKDSATQSMIDVLGGYK